MTRAGRHVPARAPELAIAYLDLGDAQTARTLLLEVAEGGDLHSRAQARELLARLP